MALPGGIPQHLNGLLPPQIEQEALVLQGTMSSFLSNWVRICTA